MDQRRRLEMEARALKKEKDSQPKASKPKNKRTPKDNTQEPVEDKSKKPATRRVAISTEYAKPVEQIDEEVKFIKRYVLLRGKEKTKEQILSFINSLQKAIVEKRIRKSSQYAEQIRYIQNILIKVYNNMGKNTLLKIRDNVLSEMLVELNGHIYHIVFPP